MKRTGKGDMRDRFLIDGLFNPFFSSFPLFTPSTYDMQKLCRAIKLDDRLVTQTGFPRKMDQALRFEITRLPLEIHSLLRLPL